MEENQRGRRHSGSPEQAGEPSRRARTFEHSQREHPEIARVTYLARVLIVDDEPIVLSTLSRLFVRWGYETVTAATAEEAIDRLAEAPVDMAVIDYMLPGGMKGLDLARYIRDRQPDTGIIIISGYNTDTELTEGVVGLADRFMPKSKDYNVLRELLAEVYELVKERRQRRGVSSSPTPDPPENPVQRRISSSKLPRYVEIPIPPSPGTSKKTPRRHASNKLPRPISNDRLRQPSNATPNLPSEPFSGQRRTQDRDHILKAGDLEVDLLSRRVKRRGASGIKLSLAELVLLAHMVQFKGQVISNRELAEVLRRNKEYSASKAYPIRSRNLEARIPSHIHALRREIEPDPAHPMYILTVRSAGYRVSKRPSPRRGS